MFSSLSLELSQDFWNREIHILENEKSKRTNQNFTSEQKSIKTSISLRNHIKTMKKDLQNTISQSTKRSTGNCIFFNKRNRNRDHNMWPMKVVELEKG